MALEVIRARFHNEWLVADIDLRIRPIDGVTEIRGQREPLVGDKVHSLLVRESAILSLFGDDPELLRSVGYASVAEIVGAVVGDCKGVLKSRALRSKRDAGLIAEA